jgi:hypothetical protein
MQPLDCSGESFDLISALTAARDPFCVKPHDQDPERTLSAGGGPRTAPAPCHLPSNSMLAGTEVSIGMRVAAHRISELAH